MFDEKCYRYSWSCTLNNSTTSRVTALRGILGVNARQVCRFEAKIWLSYIYKFYHYNTSVISNNYIITLVW